MSDDIWPQISSQVEQEAQAIKDSGFVLPDEAKAKYYLLKIGHYRLSTYIDALVSAYDTNSKIEPTFDHLLELYKFDRKLRLLSLDALERIEIAIKSELHHCLSLSFGEKWYVNGHIDIDSGLRGQIDKFVRHRTNPQSQNDIKQIPASKSDENNSRFIIRALTFGQVSQLYISLPSKVKDNIARRYSTRYPILQSCLRSLTTVRNICAHHDCLWNLKLITKPKIPDYVTKKFGSTHLYQNYDETFFAQAMIMYYFLLHTARNSSWNDRLFKLTNEYQQRLLNYHILNRMGFPKNWAEIPFWRLSID